jgi:hypothetical protein
MIPSPEGWKHEPVDISMRIKFTPHAQPLLEFEVWAGVSCKVLCKFLERIDLAAECRWAFGLKNGVWRLSEQPLKRHTLLNHLVQTCRHKRGMHALQDSVEKHSHRDGARVASNQSNPD